MKVKTRNIAQLMAVTLMASTSLTSVTAMAAIPMSPAIIDTTSAEQTQAYLDYMNSYIEKYPHMERQIRTAAIQERPDLYSQIAVGDFQDIPLPSQQPGNTPDQSVNRSETNTKPQDAGQDTDAPKEAQKTPEPTPQTPKVNPTQITPVVEASSFPWGWAILGGLGAGGIAAAAGGGGGDSKSSASPAGDNPGEDDNGGGDDGGGDDGGGDENTGPTPSDFDTFEFRRNRGNKTLNAHHAYAKGFTGEGAVIAIVDDGIDLDTLGEELQDKINVSIDFVNEDDAGLPEGNHAGFIAGILVGAKNDTKSHGIAFGATINDYKAGSEDGSLQGGHVIQAFRQAKTDGSHFVNASFGSEFEFESSDEVDADFFRLVHQGEMDAVNDFHSDVETNYLGTLIVYAAGNDGNEQPNAQGLFPVFRPELQDILIVVVALSDDYDVNDFTPDELTLADFSNKCGDAAQWCLAAPGERLVSENSDGSSLFGSGTSFATPFVVGAGAILRQAFPALTAEEIQSILLQTATDLGEPGTDPVFGRGLVNIEQALLPIGQLQRYDRDGSSYTVNDEQNGYYSSRNSAVLASASLATPVYDQYDRRYTIDASSGSKTQDGLRLSRELTNMIDVHTAHQNNQAHMISVSFADGGHYVENGHTGLFFYKGRDAATTGHGKNISRAMFGLSSDTEAAMGYIAPDQKGLGFTGGFGDGYQFAIPSYHTAFNGAAVGIFLPVQIEKDQVLGERGQGLSDTSGDSHTIGVSAVMSYSLSEKWHIDASGGVFRTQFTQSGQNGFIKSLEGVGLQGSVQMAYRVPGTHYKAELSVPMHFTNADVETEHFAPRIGMVSERVSLTPKTPVKIGLSGSFDDVLNGTAFIAASYHLTDYVDNWGAANILTGWTMQF